MAFARWYWHCFFYHLLERYINNEQTAFQEEHGDKAIHYKKRQQSEWNGRGGSLEALSPLHSSKDKVREAKRKREALWVGGTAKDSEGVLMKSLKTDAH